MQVPLGQRLHVAGLAWMKCPGGGCIFDLLGCPCGSVVLVVVVTSGNNGNRQRAIVISYDVHDRPLPAQGDIQPFQTIRPGHPRTRSKTPLPVTSFATRTSRENEPVAIRP